MKSASIFGVAALFVCIATQAQGGWWHHHHRHQPVYVYPAFVPMGFVPGTTTTTNNTPAAPTDNGGTIEIESGAIREAAARIMADRAALRGPSVEAPAAPAVNMDRILQGLSEMEGRLNQKIDGVDQKIDAVKAELKQEIQELRGDVRALVEALNRGAPAPGGVPRGGAAPRGGLQLPPPIEIQPQDEKN
jgi:hypothetical protein